MTEIGLKERLKRLKDAHAWRLMKSDFGPKIFVVGYFKTGTTSVGKALQLLGYKHSSFNHHAFRKLYNKRRIEELIRFTSKFESFDDAPWLKEDVIPIMDKAFPKSKWIYLERDEKSWKNSWRKWRTSLNKDSDPDQEWVSYQKHAVFIKQYFKERGNSHFIALDVRDPEGFEKLGSFLGKTPPNSSFPHENKSPHDLVTS